MAGHAPSFDVTHLEGKRIAIISARWHREICQAMVAGAQRALTSAGITNPDLIELEMGRAHV